MQTIVLNGIGPRARIKSGANSKLIVAGKDKVVVLSAKDTSTVKFAA